MNAIHLSRLAAPDFKADPYPFYRRMRAEAPVFAVRGPMSVRAWLVTRYGDVATVLKDERFSKDITAKMPWLPRFARPVTSHMLNRDAPDHTRLRALVSKAFTPRRVEELGGRVQGICDDLLARSKPGDSFDLLTGYALALPLTVIAELLGIPRAERRQFHFLARGSLPLGAPSNLLDVSRAVPSVWMLTRFFERLFAERRARPSDDLLSALIQAEDGGDRLSKAELLGMAFLLLLARYETTVNLIGNGALALLQHPDQRARFVADPQLTAPAIEELLRHTSPVEIAPPRVAREAITLASVTIAPGELVAAVIGSANRDEAQFPNPDTLDLGRHPNRHLALGHGPHYCLGASLARLECDAALTTLFRRFPAVRLQSSAALRWRKSVPMRGLKSLPVVL